MGERRIGGDEATRISAEEVKRMLGLEPHPREGGWFRRTYQAAVRADLAHLPGEAPPRWAGTAIYYLLEPGTFSEMHRLRSDELFHFYAGDAVEQMQLRPDGRGERVVIGPDLVRGERPQVLVPAGVWQGARLVAGGSWALLGCTVSPGFEYEDYESGTEAELAKGWPAWAGMIGELCR